MVAFGFKEKDNYCMSKVLVLTGPAGAGKNTVAHELAKKREKCAVVDIDLVRWMVLQPHKAPWEGEEGQKQVLLGVKNGLMLAKNFTDEGYDVVILDVISDEIAAIYKNKLEVLNPKIVLLLPSFEEIKKRNSSRPPRLTEGRIKYLYEMEEKLTLYDKKIDNTNLTPEEVAEELSKFMDS